MYRILPAGAPVPCLFLALMALLPAGAVQAQSRLDAPSAEQLVSALSGAMPDAPAPLATRSLRALKAKAPDVLTNVCDAPGNVLPPPAAGGATRNLYVSDAPKVDLNVRFALDSARLTPAGLQLLDTLGTALNSPELRSQHFVIAGHTDNRGADAYNKRLSCERALVVRDHLLKKHAIDPERLVALGFGADKPVDPADPAQEINRRVEVRKF